MENLITEGLAKPWGELALYHVYAMDMISGGIPYVDFFPEYPPLALWLFKLPLVLGDTQHYMLIFYAMVGAAVLLTGLLIKRMSGNPFVFFASILALGGLFWDRFDIFPAFLSLLAIYFLTKDQYELSFGALSLGVLTKVYPVVFLPILILKTLLKGGLDRFFLASLVFLLPILIAAQVIVAQGGREGLDRLLEFHAERGIQIESLKATPILYKGLKGEYEPVVEYKHNTYEIK